MLWTVVAVATCALATATAGREAVTSARNRIALARAGWHAEDCVARALATTDALLAGTTRPTALARSDESPSAVAWRTLDRELGDTSGDIGRCRLTVVPVDTIPLMTGGMAGMAAVAPPSAPAPELWTVTARARDGLPAVTAVLEVRVARAGVRPAVVRRRTWVE